MAKSVLDAALATAHELIAMGCLRGRFGAVPKIRTDLLKLAGAPGGT
jgi:hypothetical protein